MGEGSRVQSSAFPLSRSDYLFIYLLIKAKGTKATYIAVKITRLKYK